MSERVLLLSWWIFAILFNSLYTSVLVSLLLVTEFGPEISKVEELAFRSSYSLCLQQGGTQTDIFSVIMFFLIQYACKSFAVSFNFFQNIIFMNCDCDKVEEMQN